MKRRSFLKILAGFMAGPAIAKAMPKAMPIVESQAVVKSQGTITTGSHAKALWPGIEGWYGKEYKDQDINDLFKN
jgi:hypothetical protein